MKMPGTLPEIGFPNPVRAAKSGLWLMTLSLATGCAAAADSPLPTPGGIQNGDAAIAAVKARFPEVAAIRRTAPGAIGASTNIVMLDRADGWDWIFWQGWGDCPSGCIKNRYFYFSAKKDGQVEKRGEYARVYDKQANAFTVSGSSMWGVPK